MERLTERDEYGNADIIGVDSMDLQGNLSFDELNRVTEALNRLAHYEDTGLEPEEICDMKTAYDENQIPYMIEAAGSEAVHIHNLLLAEAQGRLVEVVHCKDCEFWDMEIGWCKEHSSFIDEKGGKCHPWESDNWRAFEPDDFCSYGERKTQSTIGQVKKD